MGSILKNNSLKISTLLNQNSNSLKTNLIQDISNLLSAFKPVDIGKILLNLPNDILKNQSNFLTSLLESLDTWFSPLNSYNQESTTIMNKLIINTQDSLAKNELILSYITNENFFKDLLLKFEALIKMD
jgi:hypothetical protein